MSQPIHKFWTFVPQSLTIRAEQINGALYPAAEIRGWFAFSSISSVENEKGGNEPKLSTNPLTPADTPVILNLGPEHFPNISVNELSVKTVIDALNAMFSLPFNDIPPAPKDIKANTPPSKRAKKG